MDDKQKYELKIQALREALRERVASITDEYENKIADLRIELTELAMAFQEANKELAEIHDRDNGTENSEE